MHLRKWRSCNRYNAKTAKEIFDCPLPKLILNHDFNLLKLQTRPLVLQHPQHPRDLPGHHRVQRADVLPRLHIQPPVLLTHPQKPLRRPLVALRAFRSVLVWLVLQPSQAVHVVSHAERHAGHGSCCVEHGAKCALEVFTSLLIKGESIVRGGACCA